MTKNVFLLFAATFSLLIGGCGQSSNSDGHNEDGPENDEHVWTEAEYEWFDYYGQCRATRTCTVHEHSETETVNSTYEVVTPAECESDGIAQYVATFKNPAFEKQTHKVTLEQTGHNWADIKYVFSSDYSTCTATKECLNNVEHNIVETVNTTLDFYEEAKCEEYGSFAVTAYFTNPVFETQHVELDILPINHEWGEPTFEWSEDNYICTATAVCLHDSSHILTEKACATLDIEHEYVPSLGKTMYINKYEVIFKNALFSKQTKDVYSDSIDFEFVSGQYNDESVLFARYLMSSNLESVFFPRAYSGKNVAIISNSDIDNHVTTISISEGVKYCNADFSKFTELTTINYPNSIVSVGDLDNCDKLKKNGTFSCTYLGNPVSPYIVLIEGYSEYIEPSCKVIYKNAFSEKNLYNAEVNIPEGVVSIGNGAFSKVKNVRKYSIPKTVIHIGSSAFSANESDMFEEISVDEDNQFYSSINGMLLTKDNKTIITVPTGIEGNVVIPNEVETIGRIAFENCQKITSINLSNSVTTLEYMAFYNCTALQNFYITKSVSSLGSSLFTNCKNLTYIHYDGTTSEWETIKKENNWAYTFYLEPIPATVVHCSNGDVEI